MFLTLLIFSQWIWDPKSYCWLFSRTFRPLCFNNKKTMEHDKEWVSPPVSYGQWFWYCQTKTESSVLKLPIVIHVKIITISLINHHWPIINHHHHHSHWLTAYEAKCKHYAKCLSIYTVVCLHRRLQLFPHPWAGTFAVWPTLSPLRSSAYFPLFLNLVWSRTV